MYDGLQQLRRERVKGKTKSGSEESTTAIGPEAPRNWKCHQKCCQSRGALEVGPKVPQRCPRGAAEVPQRCPRGAPEVPQRCPRGAAEVPQRCPRGAPEVRHRWPGCLELLIELLFSDALCDILSDILSDICSNSSVLFCRHSDMFCCILAHTVCVQRAAAACKLAGRVNPKDSAS